MQQVLNNSTGEMVGFPDETSGDEIQSAIRGDQFGEITPPPNTFYDRTFKPALESVGIRNPGVALRSFGSGVMDAATFGALHPTDQWAKTYKESFPAANAAGQFVGFTGPAIALSEFNVGAWAKGAELLSKVPGVAEFAGNVTKAIQASKGLTTAANVASHGLQSAALMGEYSGISGAVQEGERTGFNPAEMDWHGIGENALKQAGIWGLVGAFTGGIVKPTAGMSLAEMAAQRGKEIAATSGAMYAASRASGADHKDSLLMAGMAAIAHGIFTMPDTIQGRRMALQATQELTSHYVNAKVNADPQIPEIAAKEHIQSLADQVIQENGVNLEKENDTQQIHDDIKKNLIAAGQREDLADSNAAIYTAVATQSAKLRGVSPLEYHLANGPEVWSAEGVDPAAKPPVRGWVDLAKNKDESHKIFLSANADASTFVHELAHTWLHDFKGFMESGAANDRATQDWGTIKSWLKIHGNQKEVTTDQHELFARGFERYLREGRAPSMQVADAFARFKTWLSDIYKNVRDLKAPISSNVRDVMDRMLADEENPVNKIAQNAELTRKLTKKFIEQVSGQDPKQSRPLQDKFDSVIDLEDIVPASNKDVLGVRDNIENVMAAYDKATMEEYKTDRPVVSSGDLPKTMDLPFRDKFRSTDSVSRHAAASAVSKIFDEQRLTDPADAGKPVLVLGGTSGAGKTHVTKSLDLNLGKDFALVKDTNLNSLKSGQKIIEKALKYNHPVDVMLIERDPVEAFKDGVYKRFTDKPEHRIVPVDIHIKNSEARDAFPQILENYKDNPNVTFRVVHNKTGEVPSGMPIEDLKPLSYTPDEMKKSILDFLEKERVSGRLKEADYNEFVGKSEASGQNGESRGVGLQEKSALGETGKPQELNIANEPIGTLLQSGKEKQNASGERANAALESVKEHAQEIVNLLAPKIGVPRAALDKIYEMKGGRDKVEFELERQMAGIENQFEKATHEDNIDFIDRVKLGDQQTTPEKQAIADMMRAVEDAYFEEVQKYKPDLPYLENHFRVFWKDAGAKVDKGFSVLYKRPLEGNKGFMKRHVLDDMSQGIELGLQPVSYNPMTMWRNHIMDMQKFITARKMFDAMKELGLAQYVKSSGEAPDGFVRLDDRIAKVYFPAEIKFSEDAEGVKVPHLVGEFWVEKNTGRILNNFLMKDSVRASVWGKSLLALKNVTTAMELAISPFHAAYETGAATASKIGLGFQKVAGKDLSGLGDIFSAPLAPFEYSSLGGSAIKMVESPEDFIKTSRGEDFLKRFPDAQNLLDDAFKSGLKFAIHQDYKINSLKAFKNGIQERDPLAVAFSSIPAINEWAMKPIFEMYIPRLKLGAFLKEFSAALVTHKAVLDSGEMTRAELGRNVADSIENRFGEMNFDNLFWDKNWKSSLQLLLRSVTWKVGALKNVGVAIPEQIAEIMSAAKHRRAPILKPGFGYLLGVAAMVTTMSAIMQKLSIDEWPSSWKDILAPRYNKEGDRIMLNTHMKDWVHMVHSVPDFIKSSMSGEIGKLIMLWQDKDFYGTEIYHADDKWQRRAWDATRFLVPTPFSISSYQRILSTGSPLSIKAATLAGFTQPVPRYISDTPAQALASEIMRRHLPEGARTKEQFQRSQLKHQLMLDYERTQDEGPINKAIDEGHISEKEKQDIFKKSEMAPIVRTTHHFSVEELMKVLDKASAEEWDLLSGMLEQKYEHKLEDAKLTEADREELTDSFDAFKKKHADKF